MRESFTQEAAETLALKALAWLAAMQDDIGRFLNISGIEAGELRERAGEPEFLAAVMDFLLADDKLLTGFCDAEGLDPKDIHRARRALPGAHEP
jgi:predicted pyridoxine 5'-phosphate oxidase superfamily flavin-nucleotide-binding protein